MKTYLHYKDKSAFYEKGMFVFLILFTLFGWYKNGLTYVFMDKMSFLSSLKNFILPLISLGEGIIISLLMKKENKLSLINNSLLFPLLFPPALSFKWGLLFLSAFNFWQCICKLKNIKLENVLLFKMLLIIFCFLQNIGLQNEMEKMNSYSYQTLDILLGISVGSFGITSIILSLFLYLFLSTDFYYKKDLPIIIISSYLLSGLLYSIIKTPLWQSTFLLNSSLIFAAIYFSRNNFITPITRMGKMLYGILIGLISFVLNLLGISEGVFIVFSIVMLVYLFYQKIKYKV